MEWDLLWEITLIGISFLFLIKQHYRKWAIVCWECMLQDWVSAVTERKLEKSFSLLSDYYSILLTPYISLIFRYRSVPGNVGTEGLPWSTGRGKDGRKNHLWKENLSQDLTKCSHLLDCCDPESTPFCSCRADTSWITQMSHSASVIVL